MKATHVFCTYCRDIQPAIVEPPTHTSEDGKYIGGDIQCAVCKWILATVYREVE